MHRFFSLFSKEKGAIGMEYAILVALIGCSVIMGATYLGQGVSRHFAAAGEQLQSQGQIAGAGAPDLGSAGGTGGGGAVAGDQGTPDGSGSGGTVTNDNGDTGQDSPNVSLGDTGEAQMGGQTASGS
jgi:Flp pilus assembly pilin Flp